MIRLNPNGSLYIAQDRDMNSPLETELDHYNWDYRLIAKGGETSLLKQQAITLARSVGE